MRGIQRGFSDYYEIIMCKVRLVDEGAKRREVVDGARRIRSEKLRKYSTEKDTTSLLRVRE